MSARTDKNNIFATVCKSNLRECYCCAFKHSPFFSMHVNDKKLSGEKKERAIADKYSFFFKAMLATTHSLSLHFYDFIFYCVRDAHKNSTLALSSRDTRAK